jgi:hypothetical protein
MGLWELERTRSEQFDDWGEIAEPRASHARVALIRATRKPMFTQRERVAGRLMRAWYDAEQWTRETEPGSKSELAAMRRSLRKFEQLCAHLDATGLAGTYWDPRGEKEEN